MLTIPQSRRWIALTGLVLAIGLVTGCAKKTYPVNLSPTYHPGQKFSLSADSTQQTHVEATLTPKGEATSQTKTQDGQGIAHLEGEGEVLAVFPNGNVQKVLLTVQIFTATKNGQSIPGLPAAGANITVEWSEQGRVVVIDGQSANADLAKTVGDVLNIGDLFGFAKSSQTDQDAFGPGQAVAIGATWPVNAEAVSRALHSAMESDVSGVQGTMKLDAVTGEGDERVFIVSGNLSPESVKPKMSPEVVVDSVALNAEISEQVPVTTTKGKLKQAAALHLKITGRADNEAIKIKLSIQSEVKNSREVTFH